MSWNRRNPNKDQLLIPKHKEIILVPCRLLSWAKSDFWWQIISIFFGSSLHGFSSHNGQLRAPTFLQLNRTKTTATERVCPKKSFIILGQGFRTFVFWYPINKWSGQQRMQSSCCSGNETSVRINFVLTHPRADCFHCPADNNKLLMASSPI